VQNCGVLKHDHGLITSLQNANDDTPNQGLTWILYTAWLNDKSVRLLIRAARTGSTEKIVDSSALLRRVNRCDDACLVFCSAHGDERFQ
jgi:hypothetical protein